MTYPYIMNRMMNRIKDKYPELDYREGSIVFNALADAGMEFAIAYNELDNVLNESFVQTATRHYILLGCRQVGMDTTQFEASAGVYKGVFNVPVEIGSRWNLDIYNYVVEEQMSGEAEYPGMYIYRMVCETLGSAPNTLVGNLQPIDVEVPGLTVAQLVEILILGEDEATEEEMRERYQDFVDNVESDGNVEQYYEWCSEYDGIGKHKVFSLWNGVNTVKVSILDVENNVATDELIEEFQNYLDPPTEDIDDNKEAENYPQGRGMGNGKAPIGAIVTVTTATAVPINISCKIHYSDGYDKKLQIEQAIRNYLSELAYDRYVVSYIAIGAAILSVEGVDTITDLTINDGTKDVNLEEEQIATLGTTDWTVV